MKRMLAFLVMAAAMVCAQDVSKPDASKPAGPVPSPAPTAPAPVVQLDPLVKAAQEEMSDLTRSLQEAGNSPNDYIRALEAHLAKYPKTARRAEIERALAKSAMEARDDARIIQYGEKTLERDPSDLQMIERVARAYLAHGDKDGAQRALDYAKKYEDAVAGLRKQAAPGRVSPGQWADELDRGTARAFNLQAQAELILGEKKQAVKLAQKGFEWYPSSEGARQLSHAEELNGDTAEAIEHLADAFTIDDTRNTEVDRARDRRHLGELYTKANGSEKGLGEVVLKAYDYTSSLIADRTARLKSKDPNTQAAGILDFVLPGVNGSDLPLLSLKGKTVVLDFWATWCVPCKAQRPLYEEVAKHFKDKANVVFLSVNTDEDRTLVAPFVKAQKWTNPVYYDGGLSDFVKVSSIPTTLIVGKNGEVASRMNGFIPERFVDLLSARITETLQ